VQGKNYHPRVPGLVTTTWYDAFLNAGKHPNMWTAWYIRYMEDHGLYCLYSNPPQRRGLVANWNEKGVHPGQPGLIGKRSHVLQETWDQGLQRMPPAPELVRLGWNGKPEARRKHAR